MPSPKGILLHGERLSGRDARWLTAALVTAEQSTGPHRHGAVLVRGNRVVGRGWNRVQPPPAAGVQPWHIKWRHAEEAAVMDAGDEAVGAALYVARFSEVYGAVLSEPCPRCWKAIRRFGISRVRWT